MTEMLAISIGVAITGGLIGLVFGCIIGREYSPNWDLLRRLAQENEELQHKVDTLQGFLDHDIEYDMDKAIQNLKKENAELQGSLELYENGCCRAEKECAIKDQLVQAKEIIRELLSWERRADYDYSEYDLIKDRAEQFLKEIEK